MKFLPDHWAFRGPSPARPAVNLLKHTEVPAAHADTVRRLFRIGPWTLLVVRYRPGPDPTEPPVEWRPGTPAWIPETYDYLTRPPAPLRKEP